VKHRRFYFRVENGKANMAPPPEAADWFRLGPVQLGNGDSPLYDNGDEVAVVTKWEWPNLVADMTVDHADEVFAKIRAGRWRADPQAKAWVGYAAGKSYSSTRARRRARRGSRPRSTCGVRAGGSRSSRARTTRAWTKSSARWHRRSADRFRTSAPEVRMRCGGAEDRRGRLWAHPTLVQAVPTAIAANGGQPRIQPCEKCSVLPFQDRSCQRQSQKHRARNGQFARI